VIKNEQEKKEKRKLEARIREMNSQLLVGGVVDSQAFRSALAAEQSRIRKEYEEKLGALERERQSMEEDKAQVDRYKQLLLKQRDIMIQLTARLNERDQSILVLQEELDSYDKQQRLMEDALDQKTAMLIRLQKVAVELQQYPGVKEMLNGMGESEIESSSMFTPTNQNAGSVAQATPVASQGIAPSSNSGNSNNKRAHLDEHLSTAVSQEISAFVQNEVPALTAGGFMIGGSGTFVFVQNNIYFVVILNVVICFLIQVPRLIRRHLRWSRRFVRKWSVCCSTSCRCVIRTAAAIHTVLITDTAIMAAITAVRAKKSNVSSLNSLKHRRLWNSLRLALPPRLTLVRLLMFPPQCFDLLSCSTE
jgi:hypothetical protein